MSDTHLYGRLWGSIIYIPFLHFEICYYQAIDYAIKNKFQIIHHGAYIYIKFTICKFLKIKRSKTFNYLNIF